MWVPSIGNSHQKECKTGSKVSERKDKPRVKNFFVGKRDVDRAIQANKLVLLILFCENITIKNTNTVLPSIITVLLQEYQDILPDKLPDRLSIKLILYQDP